MSYRLRPGRMLFAAALGLLGSLSLSGPALAGGEIGQFSLEWHPERHRVRLEAEGSNAGEAGERVRVVVSDAGSGRTLFERPMRLRSGGAWRLNRSLRLREPLPCALQIEVAGARRSEALTPAPAGCGGETPRPAAVPVPVPVAAAAAAAPVATDEPPETPNATDGAAGPQGAAALEVREARWEADRRRLLLSFEGVDTSLAGGPVRVEVFDARSGERLARYRQRVDREGHWAVSRRLRRRGAPPCAIRVTAGAVQVETAVEQASGGCAGSLAPAPAPVADPVASPEHQEEPVAAPPQASEPGSSTPPASAAPADTATSTGDPEEPTEEEGPRPAAASGSLLLESVEWDAERGRLKFAAKGVDPAQAGARLLVQVSDAERGDGLASYRPRVNDEGRWSLERRIRDIETPPCRIRVDAGALSAEAGVEPAPERCDAQGPVNQPPVADAGPDRSLQLQPGQGSLEVTLDGSASRDPDGEILAYRWSGTPDPADAAVSTLSLGAGDYLFTLEVTDAAGASDRDQVRIQVLPATGGGGGGGAAISINSTSRNAAGLRPPVPQQPLEGDGGHALLAANDLGMHCADLDYQIFSILPPFNVMHAQVVRRGGEPELLDDTSVEVVYSAAANPQDPALARAEVLPIFKSNFWGDPDGDGRTFGYDAYAPLYFGLLEPGDLSTPDTGLPVPDSILLRGCLRDYLNGMEGPAGPRTRCGLGQQGMPGRGAPYASNEPVLFDRFDRDFNFFDELLGGTGLGGIRRGVNWFAADGVPVSPVDDSGRSNAYPLMRVQARSRSTGAVLASTDVVTPVASEADCQLCHAPALDCAAVDPGLDCREYGINRTAFKVLTLDGNADGSDPGVLPPGDTDLQRLLNVAKINILRLHDAKHGTDLQHQTPVQCSTCHYSPALDLAQLGPTDSPATQQTTHISMSRAMHGYHGGLEDDQGGLLFPDMPSPAGRSLAERDRVLEQTCYACHPGKRTQCLRGAMAKGGVVCQDCHGEMRHLGNDFSGELAQNPWPGGANLAKRVPWASEPGCQSCHTGDVLDNLAGSAGVPVASDGIRLLQAYTIQAGLDRNGNPDGTEVARPLVAANRRFAEDASLYRLSKGHGGVMCEGCHGSTHAIFPNPLDSANDNLAAKQLQGHAGTVVECSTCHTGDLGVTLEGPHGMHPVGDTGFSRGGHEDLAEHDKDACRACHGRNGEGSVLSRTATDRLLTADEDGRRTVDLPKGTRVRCDTCHENKL